MTVDTQAAGGVPSPDYGPQNPFWPVGGPPSGYEEPGAAGAGNAVSITSVTFDGSSNPTVTVTTFPAASAWTINWGDGTATDSVTAGTLTKSHTYANKTQGQLYMLTVVSGADTDKRQIQY